MLFIGIMFLVKNVIDIVKGIHEDRVYKKRHDELIDALYECADSFKEGNKIIDKMDVVVYQKEVLEEQEEKLKFGDE